ncbi:MAG: hypothetical protein CM1200mP41_17220 [Gammaproteobacteria bacterium]|nr:MAG: hypothetical protein CM1200mP41_17220 [Gammaproteobacteria bacterium]
MESFGATCHASPSNRTESGKKILADTPDSTGSLGIAISEAVECAAQRDDTKYSLGSVLNHVLMHQTVVGQEALRQMEMATITLTWYWLYRGRKQFCRPCLPVYRSKTAR